MRTIRRLLFLGGLAAGIAALRAEVLRRADEAHQTPQDYLAHTFRGFLTHRFDPIVVRLGLAGGMRSPWALVEHVGRVTKQIHHTPIAPRLTETSVFIPLPYGTDVQWLRNVQAAGHCRMQLHERLYDLDEPRIVGGAEVEALPQAGRDAAEKMGWKYLALHRLADVPGTFSHTPEGTVVPTEPEWAIPAEAPAAELPVEIPEVPEVAGA